MMYFPTHYPRYEENIFALIVLAVLCLILYLASRVYLLTNRARRGERDVAESVSIILEEIAK